MVLVHFLLLVYFAPSYAHPQRDGDEAISLHLCTEVINSSSLAHTSPTIMPNQDLTSSVYNNGKYENCLLNSSSRLRIELPRMARVSDVGVRLNASKVFVRLVLDVKSYESIFYDCSKVGSIENDGFTYFPCKNSKGEYDRQGMMVNAVELSTANEPIVISLLSNQPWMFIIRKGYDDHPYFGRRGCLAPGLYGTRVLAVSEPVYPYGHTVSFRCKPAADDNYLARFGRNRTCSEKGWSGGPAVCLSKTEGFGYVYNFLSPGELVSKNEMIYQVNYTFVEFTRVAVHLECFAPPCRNGHLKSTPRVEISLERVLPEMKMDWNSTWHFNRTPPLAVFQMKSPPGKWQCHDCVVKVKFDDYNWPQHWKLTKFAIVGWTRSQYERYLWMMDGCPPIDPYIGMPDEYAGDEAARKSQDLNKNLRENPCREGYWHNRTVQYDKSPRACIRNAWTGEIPICVPVTCRSPPRIENGHWDYRDGAFHKVGYVCDEPLVPSSGHGIARCNYIKNEWDEVPSCIVSPTSNSSDRTTADNVAKRTMDRCSPIEPYLGMPEDYESLSVENSLDTLNRNLRENPCREGYWQDRVVQFKQNPRQCIRNEWIGEVPQCIEILCPISPLLENVSWRYHGNGLSHELVYSCDEPLVPSTGRGIATCNSTTLAWEEVPSCIENSDTLDNNIVLSNAIWISLAAISALVVLTVAVVIIILLRKRKYSDYVKAIPRSLFKTESKESKSKHIKGAQWTASQLSESNDYSSVKYDSLTKDLTAKEKNSDAEHRASLNFYEALICCEPFENAKEKNADADDTSANFYETLT